METNEKMTQIRDRVLSGAVTAADAGALLAEIDRLENFVADYGRRVNAKLDEIERDMATLEGENQRLVTVKDGAYLERTLCAGLAARLAVALGVKAGIWRADANPALCIDLPSGQVSWDLTPDEESLFDFLPDYVATRDVLEPEENYARVLNPGIASS